MKLNDTNSFEISGSGDQSVSRSAIMSPSQTHRDYNRMKYYSALKTGFRHMGNESDILQPPVHVIDQNLFLLQIPFAKARKYYRISLAIILAIILSGLL